MTHDGGLTWVPVSGLDGKVGSIMQVKFDPQVAGTVYALVVPPGADTFTPDVLYRSRDGGVTWSALTTPSIDMLFIDPQDGAILYASPGLDMNGDEHYYGQGLLRSADAGTTWTAVTGTDLAQVTGANVAIDPTTPTNVYAWGAVITGGQVSTRLFKSIDRGLTWSPLTISGFIEGLAVDPNSSATVYASASARLQKSIDGGVTWTVVNTPPLPALVVPNVVIAPTDPSTVYWSGNWRSSDGGATWAQVPSAGLGSIIDGCQVVPQDPQRLITGAFEAGLQTQTVAAAPVACTPGPAALCLTGSRFQVTATWQTAGASGAAQVLPLTADTGALWFFSAANIELLVKVIDGCSVNGSYWVFIGGLTNLAVTVTVTDTQTGAVQTYANPAGVPLPPIQDTAALGDCP
ncbi:MAG: hypothetical protein JOZ15_01035 [Acidobacteria bacterium]|nr:hypothetical protein [Acidobacteriota bacterium]